MLSLRSTQPRDPFKDGGFSMSHFLADNETLDEVIQRDQQTLQRYGVTCQQVADKLEEFIQRWIQRRNGQLSFEDTQFLQRNPFPRQNLKIDTLRNVPPQFIGIYPLDNRYIMGGISTAGTQFCPFQQPGCTGGNSDYFIYDTQTKEHIEFGNLLIHLVRDHCFFEGNVAYRLDPEKAIRILGLSSGPVRPSTRPVTQPKVQSSLRPVTQPKIRPVTQPRPTVQPKVRPTVQSRPSVQSPMRTPPPKWKFRTMRVYNRDDLSEHMEFLPGVFGILRDDNLELVNTNAQPVTIPGDMVNDVYLDQITLTPTGIYEFTQG